MEKSILAYIEEILESPIAVGVSDIVTHWMPLPEPPEED